MSIHVLPKPSVQAAMLRAARERFDELTDEAIVAIGDAVVQVRAGTKPRLDPAIRDVADTLGEDWRVVLACFRTCHPGPVVNPIAQHADGSRRRTPVVPIEDDSPQKEAGRAAARARASRRRYKERHR